VGPGANPAPPCYSVVMNWIGAFAVLLFVVGWIGGIAAWVYATIHILRAWFTIDGWRGIHQHGRKTLRGAVAFVGCWIFAASNGLIGVWFGGWQVAAGGH